jgi:hypothetical protein
MAFGCHSSAVFCCKGYGLLRGLRGFAPVVRQDRAAARLSAGRCRGRFTSWFVARELLRSPRWPVERLLQRSGDSDAEPSPSAFWRAPFVGEHAALAIASTASSGSFAVARLSIAARDRRDAFMSRFHRREAMLTLIASGFLAFVRRSYNGEARCSSGPSTRMVVRAKSST